MIKYNLNNINDWNYGDDNIKKVYHHNSVCYQKIYSGSTATWIAKLTLNDGSVVDIEDDGTGELKRSMTSAYVATCISAEITTACTKTDHSFSQFHYLTGVTIPNTVTEIGGDTFLGTKLVDVVVPDSVQTIGGGAFARISTLRTITFGSGCTSIGRAMTQESKQTKIVFKSPQNPISDYDFWFYKGARNGVIEYPCDGTGYDVMMSEFKKKESNVGNNGTVNTWTEQCKQYNNKI